MLVKVSYFPNWQVDGAEGPYRVAPNLMVVVPTENEVRLHFDRSTSDLVFYLLTLVGIGMCSSCAATATSTSSPAGRRRHR